MPSSTMLKPIELATLITCNAIFYILVVIVIPSLALCEVLRQIVRVYLHLKHGKNVCFVRNMETIFLLDVKPVLVDTYMIFKGKFYIKEIQEAVERNWLNVKTDGKFQYPQLRSTINKTFGYFYWLPYKNFNIEDHVKLYSCKPPQTREEFLQICTEIVNTPLHSDKPLWMLHVFPLNYTSEHSYVIFARFNHALVDGRNLVRLMAKCFLNEEQVKYLPEKKRPNKIIVPPLFNSFRALFHGPKIFLSLLTTFDVNVLHGPKQSGRKLLATSKPIDIDKLKAAGKSLNCTVNDIVLTCAYKAFYRYFKDQNAPPLTFRTLIPISMHCEGDEVTFCNNLFALLIAPVMSDCTEKCLRGVQSEMELLKDDKFVSAAFSALTPLLNHVPSFIINPFVERIADMTYFCSNIAAYQNGCSMPEGDELLEYAIFAPTPYKTCLGSVFTSCNGKIILTLVADMAVIDDSHTLLSIVQCFEEEIEGFFQMSLIKDGDHSLAVN